MSEGINHPINEFASCRGKTVHGATLGILMLETRFPRICGDVGNAISFDFPVLYKVVPGATSYRVVREQGAGLDDAFANAAKELVQIGADGIGTSCGFLSLFQNKLANVAGVPVATSSLMQVPWVQRTLPPGKRVGVITISSETLTPAHLEAAGAPIDTPVIGTEDGIEFTKAITGGSRALDVDASKADIIAAGHHLIKHHPEIGALVLECTNMGPYSRHLNKSLGVPVFDILSLLNWFQLGLRPRRFLT